LRALVRVAEQSCIIVDERLVHNTLWQCQKTGCSLPTSMTPYLRLPQAVRTAAFPLEGATGKRMSATLQTLTRKRCRVAHEKARLAHIKWHANLIVPPVLRPEA
jgi:hypothetical protein